MTAASSILPALPLAAFPRLVFAAILALAACGGGGGGDAPPVEPPPNPNPAPAPDPVESIDMDGSWRLDVANVVSGTGTALPVGTIILVMDNQVRFVLLPGNELIPTLQDEIEAELAFDLDWYQNFGDSSFLDYGYGWDRLNFPGGGGTHPAYTQYGIRVIATSADTLAGFEAEWTQDLPAAPRIEHLASLTFNRM